MVAVDGSATSNKALSAALEMATYFGGRSILRLIHVLDQTAYLVGSDPYGGHYGALIDVMREAGKKILADGLAIIESAGIKADTVLIDRLGAHLADTDAEECEKWDATLLMVGTHGRRGVGRMLTGSGAEQIIRVASCPVLVVRGTQEI